MSTQNKLAEAMRSLHLKFTSGNDVPVPEARITRAEWEAIEQAHTAKAAKIKNEPFTGFRDGKRGDLVVDREALHASPGYKRQIAALDELRSAQAQTQDAKDAARYRHMIETSPFMCFGASEYHKKSDLDEAIDDSIAAMAKESER